MSAAPAAEPPRDVHRLLDDFVGGTAGVDHAVAVSSDGLLIGASAGLDRDDGDHLAAVVSGFSGLARSTSRRFGFHGLRLVMIEMNGGFLVITVIADGSCLGALLAEDADVGLVGYELSLLAKRSGELLTREPVDGPAPDPVERA